MFLCEAREAVNDPAPKLMLVPAAGGDAIRILSFPSMYRSRNIRWSADGKALIYIESRNRVDNLWMQPIDGGPARQLTNFESDRIFRFDVSRDGGAFSFARGSEDSDVVMVSDFR